MAKMMVDSLLLMMLMAICMFFTTLALPQQRSTAADNDHDDGEVGQFWQISDIHLDLDYSVDGDPENQCHKDVFPKNLTKLGEFGYPTCDSPWLLVQGAVDAMKTIKADPDFVLWTGDTSPKLPQSQLNQDKILDLIEKVTVLLNATFPDAYHFPVLGNHDVYPVHQMPPDNTTTYYREILEKGKWNTLLSKTEQETFLQGGYYSRMIKPGLTAAVLNTNLWYYKNKLTKDLSDPAGQFKWLQKVLKGEKSVSHSVFIVGHVPPGSSELHSLNWLYPKFNQEYLKLIKDFSTTIHTQIFGHEHEDTYRLLRDDKGATIGSAFIQSSITPFIGGKKSVNPSVRLYQYNRDTGNILDVFQYSLDLREANKDKKANWKLEYQATKEYGVTNLMSDSLDKLTATFKGNKSENFEKYYRNSDVQFSGATCDSECKKLQLCAIENNDYTRYNACILKDDDFTADPEIVEASLPPTFPIGDNMSNPTNNTVLSHHHHPMPLYIFYILATLCALAIAFFMASAIICLRKKREPRYVRVVSLADMSAGYQG